MLSVGERPRAGWGDEGSGQAQDKRHRQEGPHSSGGQRHDACSSSSVRFQDYRVRCCYLQYKLLLLLLLAAGRGGVRLLGPR